MWQPNDRQRCGVLTSDFICSKFNFTQCKSTEGHHTRVIANIEYTHVTRCPTLQKEFLLPSSGCRVLRFPSLRSYFFYHSNSLFRLSVPYFSAPPFIFIPALLNSLLCNSFAGLCCSCRTNIMREGVEVLLHAVLISTVDRSERPASPPRPFYTPRNQTPDGRRMRATEAEQTPH